MLHSLLSSRRTAVVAPWGVSREGAIVRTSFLEGKGHASSDASTVARLQAGLLVDVESCDTDWCELRAQNTTFYLPKQQIWGVYASKVSRDV